MENFAVFAGVAVLLLTRPVFATLLKRIWNGSGLNRYRDEPLRKNEQAAEPAETPNVLAEPAETPNVPNTPTLEEPAEQAEPEPLREPDREAQKVIDNPIEDQSGDTRLNTRLGTRLGTFSSSMPSFYDMIGLLTRNNASSTLLSPVETTPENSPRAAPEAAEPISEPGSAAADRQSNSSPFFFI